MNRRILWLLLSYFIVLSLLAWSCSGTIPAEGEEEGITFADPSLEAAIRKVVDKPEVAILSSDLEWLTSLDASQRDITDLTGL